MQLTTNTTGLPASLTVAADSDARDYCVVVIKGTFQTSPDGELSLADAQQPLATVDDHYGDPATSSVRYECDFALSKPYTDVIVIGQAVTPRGRPVPTLPVRLEVQKRVKELRVFGDRNWVTSLAGVRASDPKRFTEMPLTFERGWGGQDDSRGPQQVAVELRNPVGVGFHPHRSRSDLEGWPLPNIESPASTITSPRDEYEPVGFGCIGRSWQPRVAWAGTYDEAWRNERAPYLPADFDSQFFQCAPPDQQFPLFQGGERIRCVNMAEQSEVVYVLPRRPMPVRFRFHDGDVERQAILDTVIVEPHRQQIQLVWRASVPLRKKLTALQEVGVGPRPVTAHGVPLAHRNGKPVFSRLSEAVRYLERQRRSAR